MTYTLTMSPWATLTAEDATTIIAEEARKQDPDMHLMLERVCDQMDIDHMEALLAGLIPDAWLPVLLPRVWAFSSNFPSMYAGSDSFVKLFERAGFVSDFLEAQRPTESMTLYRGVPNAVPRFARGIAWTTDLEKARYFSHRLDHLTDPTFESRHTVQPTVWTSVIDPDGILALFYEQNELEVVVNPRRLRKLRKIEQSMPVWPLSSEDIQTST